RELSSYLSNQFIKFGDPESKWIAKLDELIRQIRTKLSMAMEIRIDDLARELKMSDLNVTILIHLLPSIGFGYTAVGKPSPRNTVTIPGQLGIYDRLQLDDPEKIDAFLSYEGLEAQIRKLYGDELNAEERDLAHKNADTLYEKVRVLMQS